MKEEELKEIWKFEDIIRSHSDKKKEKISNLSIITKNGISYTFIHARKLLYDVYIDKKRVRLFNLIKMIGADNIWGVWDNITEERIF